MVIVYYDFKRRSGYTDEEIHRKKLSLESVLVALTPKWNEDILARTGSRHIDCFRRRCNLSCWATAK